MSEPNIVERLREEADLARITESPDGMAELLEESAAEIEKLRAGVRKWAAECAECHGTGSVQGH
jgi:hypothetical protein